MMETRSYFKKLSLNFKCKMMEKEFKKYQLKHRTYSIISTILYLALAVAAVMSVIYICEYGFGVIIPVQQYIPIWGIYSIALNNIIFYILLHKFPSHSTIFSSIYILGNNYVLNIESILSTNPPEWLLYSM